jgi:hypothetical protein
MAENENRDDDQITLAQQIFGKGASISGRNPPGPKTDDAPAASVLPAMDRDLPVSESLPPAIASSEPIETVAQQRQLMTAAELAETIELDLARHPNCPKAGFRVTVYGWPHWRAMLTISPAAGAIRNSQEWRDLTNELADRLRKRYDLA